MDDLRDTLRKIPVYGDDLPGFDAAAVPEVPDRLFRAWLDEAVAAGVTQPQAMTLSTTDAQGASNSRVLLLKRQLPGRWGFASSADSVKGQELAAEARAALLFYWPAVGRQIRLRGTVVDAGLEAAGADFRARSPGSQMESWPGLQSRPLDSEAELTAAHARAREEVDADPVPVPSHWRVYDLVADEVEFWQADADRRHVRVQYLRGSDGTWTHRLLWP